MNSRGLFDMDAILSGDSATARHGMTAVGVIIRLLLAITTAGFFFVYGAGLFAWLVGLEYGAWVSAAVGVFLLDGLAAIWPRGKEKAANTAEQMTAARIGAMADLAGSVVVTLIFIILQTSFVSTVDAAGQLTAVGQAVNVTGLAVMTLAIVGNGLLLAYYESTGAESRDAQHKAEMRALASSGQFAVERSQAELTIARTLEEIAAQMPTAAQSAGSRNADRYIAGQFGQTLATGPGQPLRRVTLSEMQHNLDEAARQPSVNGATFPH